MADATSATEAQTVHRYNASMAHEIEARWQDRWEADGTFHASNPVGALSAGFDRAASQPKRFVLDMFPYPSGVGLHVGHPLGYIGTDVYARYLRMTGYNVLHAMGYDAFGLPAEQYALQTNTHPRVTTEANVATMRRQLRALGLGHDDRRSVSTTDPAFYRWTQWIFLQLFNSWYDDESDRARPIGELEAELDAGTRHPEPGTNETGIPWASLEGDQRRAVVNRHRLAHLKEVPVNWCPGLGTVLSNEEVTADGKSERGDFPVYRRPMKQWILRITKYADRLLADLDHLDWPEPIKAQQRNWIGRSVGAEMRFTTATGPIEIFTTRPDTAFGATYMVLAPEHPLVDALIADSWPEGIPQKWTAGAPDPARAVRNYRAGASRRSDRERQANDRTASGVFIGSYATNPVNQAEIPIFVADYVLMGYGTGAIMAVPAHDQRDFEFARAFDLPIPVVIAPPEGWRDGVETGRADDWTEAFVGVGSAINSANDEVSLNGQSIDEAKATVLEWLEASSCGARRTEYKLRDWLFSRQRYWGEPFPVVFGDDGEPRALPESALPLLLPPMDDFSPVTSDDETLEPQPPLARAEDWTTVEIDLDAGEGMQTYRRDTNTMPNWAGSCWYEIRYLDPVNSERFVDAANEAYWMGPTDENDCGGVDLYVGGVEHAVLHLLYARFWHKVLYDLGHVSSSEPFRRLFNQGMIQAHVYRDARGFPVEAADVIEVDNQYYCDGAAVTREIGKMGKSLKNAVAPDEIIERFGADTLRLYEMFGGPLDQSRPWDSTAVVGMQRLLQRVWRLFVDEATGASLTSDDIPTDETRRILHGTVASVRHGMETLRFNTSIARITELTNYLTATYREGRLPREVGNALILLLAPLAPHIAEELWSRQGHDASLTHASFPTVNPDLLIATTVDVPIAVNGKVRCQITVAADATADAIEQAARSDPRVAAHLHGVTVRKVIAVPRKMVNFVLN